MAEALKYKSIQVILFKGNFEFIARIGKLTSSLGGYATLKIGFETILGNHKVTPQIRAELKEFQSICEACDWDESKIPEKIGTNMAADQ